MKKILVSLLLLVTMIFNVVAMASCGSTGSGEKPNVDDIIGELDNAGYQVPEGGYDGSEVTITFFHTMSATKLQPTLDLYIKEFNKLYPNITIEHEQIGGYDDVRDQISTEITVGNQPHIAYCYPDHVALYNLAGGVVTLDQFIESTTTVTHADGTTEILGLTQAQIDDFIEGYYEEGRQFGDADGDGKNEMYTLPLSKSTEVLYYNKTFFDQNNLEVPTTWDELEAVCAAIKEIDPNSIPLGYDSEANWFITMCEQLDTPYTSATGDHFLFDTEENRNFVERFRGWFQAGYVTTQEIYKSYTSSLFTETDPNKIKSYMTIGSSAGATHQRPTPVNNKYPFEVGIAGIPQANENNRKVISQGPSLCIFNKENPQEVIASWLFVKFLTTSIEFQAEFSMTSGYVPVIKSVQDNAYYANFLSKANGDTGIAALAAKQCMAQVDDYYTSPAFNGSSTARDEVGKLMQKCFVAETNDVKKMIEEAFDDAVEECEYKS